MSYVYACDCHNQKINRSSSALKEVEVTFNKQCVHCGHFAYLAKVSKSGRIYTHDMGTGTKKQVDQRQIADNEDGGE